MDIEETVRSYYNALEAGDPLGPYFHDAPSTVKVGIWGAHRGHDAVVEALARQTAKTTDWSVTSTALETDRIGEVGWFADDLEMAWRDTETGEAHRFEARWTGTVVRSAGEWRFATLHASAPHPR